MIQDLLIPNIEEEDCDSIPYDLIYANSTNIPTKINLVVDNDSNTKDTCLSETCLFTRQFYNDSKCFLLILFFILASTTAGLLVIIYSNL
jgi:hypothetical protein